jgi:ribonuclease III
MIEAAQVPDTIGTATFRDRALLQRALTHRSYLNEHPEVALEDNERLEFLGDAVISLITAQFLYNRFPELREGNLTRLRAALVRREALADLAFEVGLGDRLLLSRGEEDNGGRQRPAILCDAFEAVVAALYLDQGLPAARAFVEPLLQTAVTVVLAGDRHKDPRSELQELTQARFGATPAYRTVAACGPDHAKEFVVEACVSDQCFGRGRGSTKQYAARLAAADALGRLEPIDDLCLAIPAPELEAAAEIETEDAAAA